MSDLVMRPLEASDLPRLWEVLEPVFRAGDTYAVDPDIPRDAALAYWTGGGRRVYAAEAEGRLVGSFYLVRNQPGGGSHVCNCGFVTDPAARGCWSRRRS